MRLLDLLFGHFFFHGDGPRQGQRPVERGAIPVAEDADVGFAPPLVVHPDELGAPRRIATRHPRIDGLADEGDHRAVEVAGVLYVFDPRVHARKRTGHQRTPLAFSIPSAQICCSVVSWGSQLAAYFAR